MQHFGKEIAFETKSNAMDFVSFVDVTSQKMFTEKLWELFPDDVVFGEEEHDKNRDYSSEKYCWIIDPLDGTILYKHGIPFFAIMIAYVENWTVQFSSIYLPAMNELYLADETGAYRNGDEIHVSKTSTLGTSLINPTSYSLPNLFSMQEKPYLQFLKKIGTVIDVYATAYAATLCASGKIDGGVFYPNYGNVWDTIPSGFLVQQAGGKVTTIGEDTWNIWNRNMLYSNWHIHREFQEALNG